MRSDRFESYPGATLLLVFVLFGELSAFAQGVPTIKRGNLDLTGFGASSVGSSVGGVTLSNTDSVFSGKTFGAPSNNGGGGIRGTWALTRRIRIYGEWSYVGGTRSNFNTNVVVSAIPQITQQLALGIETSSSEFTGGLQWLLPIRRTPKFVPFVQTGIGGLVLGGSIRGSGAGTPPGGPIYSPIFSASINGTRLAWSAGSGVLYYFTERAGLCFEVDGFFSPTSRVVADSGSPTVIVNGGSRFGRFAYGFFYTFR